MKSWIKQLWAAWEARCPLLWITADDPAAAVADIVATAEDVPVWRWSPTTGWDRGAQDPPALNHIDATVEVALKVAENGLKRTLFIGQLLGAGAENDPAFWDAALRARRAMAAAGSMLVHVHYEGSTPPPPVAADYLAVHVARPDIARLCDVATATATAYAVARLRRDGAADYESKAKEFGGRVADALRPYLRGLTRFGAEQLAAVTAAATMQDGATDADTVDVSCAAELRRQILAAVGLRMLEVQPVELPGLEGLSRWIAMLRGKCDVVAWVDEVEKALGGSRTDTSGVSQDQLGVLLQTMQEAGMLGVLLVGPPGTGKSESAKQAARVVNAPLVQLDLGAMKGSLVGESERRIRAAMSTLSAMGRVLVVATSNDLSSVPPELRRRFLGTWFADLPDQRAREGIWRVWLQRCGLQADPQAWAARTDKWAGADIASACRLASLTGEDLDTVCGSITPVGITAAPLIRRLREAAQGVWLDARTGKPYTLPQGTTEQSRFGDE